MRSAALSWGQIPRGAGLSTEEAACHAGRGGPMRRDEGRMAVTESTTQAARPRRPERHRGGALRARPPVPQARLRAAAGALVAVAAVLIPLSRLSAGTTDPEALALVGASLAAMLLFATAWLDVLAWRLTGDARSVYLAAGALSVAAVPVLM